MFRPFINTLILILLFLSSDTFGQSELRFSQLDPEGDFSPSIIYSIAQDSAGYIWAGTEVGIIRYNSKDLVLYNRYNGLPINASNRISKIFIDRKNRIWIGMEDGILLYKNNINTFIPVANNQTDNLNLVECIVQGKGDTLWIGDYNGLWLYDINNDTLKNVFHNKIVYALEYINEGLLIGSNSGLYIYDFTNQIVKRIRINKNIDISVSCIKKIENNYLIGTMNNGLFLLDDNLKSVKLINIPVFSNRFFRINSILQTPKKSIAIGTDGAGLVYLDEDYKYINSAINDKNNPNSIASNGIYDILLGKENILWIATYGGGINYTPLNKPYFNSISHIINDENSLIFNFTRAIHEDSQGKIWFGTKQGLSIWDRQNDKWLNISSLQKSSIVPDVILALEEDNDYMWVATYGNGVFKVNKNDFTYTHYGNTVNIDQRIEISMVYSLLKDIKGNMWLGGIDGDLHEIKKDGNIIKYKVPLVKDIIELKDSSILTVGRMGGCVIKNGVIDTINELNSGQNNLHYITINSVKQNSKGNLILGTNGEGLVFYNIQNKSVEKLNISNGMPSDIVQSVLMKNDSNLWVSTTRGIAHVIISKKDTSIIIYNKDDDLINNEFNYGSGTKLANGEIAFGGVGGVTIFDPDKIKLEKAVPKLVIEDFKLLNDKNKRNDSLTYSINKNNELSLKYSESSFNIKYIGILHHSPSKVQYRWKMLGLNKNWSEPSYERQLNFVNLSPGKYELHIKASNRDGVWSKEKIVSIKISPPWWKTSLAFLTYSIIALLALGGLAYGLNLYVTKKNAEEQVDFFNSITHELKTPLAILLSTIDSIPKNMEHPAMKKIKSTSRQLINLFEQLLNFHIVTSSDQQDNLNIKKIPLITYLDKLILRFKPLMDEKSIGFEIEDKWSAKNGNENFYFDKQKLDKILFNLFSNAIKYSKQNGLIKISLDKKKDNLELSISDNGIGIPKDQQKYILKRYYRGRNAINSNLPGTGLGLMIVKTLIEKDKGSIKFTSEENEGTTFTIKLLSKKELYSSDVKKNSDTTVLSIEEQESLQEFSDTKILIVEDNDELRQNIVDKLSIYFQVYEAENGKSGFDKALEIFPDLIVTDFIMPEMDGFEMAKKLQNEISLSHIPIIMMTVLSSQKHKLESAEVGITTYLEKPLNYNYLIAKIINALGWTKRLREKYLHQVDIENAEKFRNAKDADFINRLEKYVLDEINEESLSVHNLSSHVNMSRTALYMKLKNMVDLSPQNFIIHTRLKFARKKLIEGNMSIKEVAYMSGFSNPKYFSTSFKKLFGESPTTFIKNLKTDKRDK